MPHLVAIWKNNTHKLKEKIIVLVHSQITKTTYSWNVCTCWTPPAFSNLGIILGTTTLISHWFSSGTWLFFITATTKNPDSHRLLIKRSVQSNVETESYLKVAVLTVSDWCQVLLFSPQIFKVTHVSLWISNSTVSASRAQFSERGKGLKCRRHEFKVWLHLVTNCMTLTSHWNFSEPWFLIFKNTDNNNSLSEILWRWNQMRIFITVLSTVRGTEEICSKWPFLSHPQERETLPHSPLILLWVASLH